MGFHLPGRLLGRGRFLDDADARRNPTSSITFPPPFEGLLPEGAQLEALLRNHKIDRDDAFGKLVVVGATSSVH